MKDNDGATLHFHSATCENDALTGCPSESCNEPNYRKFNLFFVNVNIERFTTVCSISSVLVLTLKMQENKFKK